VWWVSISLERKENMSKLPMESRPLRLAPEVSKVVEKALAPLKDKNLEKAQAAVLYGLPVRPADDG
jgi:hypothetical protein